MIAYSQISPGKLAKAHSHLEGISNCTQCHDLGNKVPDQKCLDCHVEIKDLISENRGYHVSEEVRNNDCVTCHNDHHGLNFDMVRFDEDNFDHNLTGYELIESHAVIDCKACHVSDYISDPDLKKRESTFLGLEQDCVACHDDYHQNTLGNDCASCHDIIKFRPAPYFDHDEADYQLWGAHINVDCIECHPMTTRNGEEFQQFTDIPFNDCVECHDTPHGNMAGSCIQCHTENTFVEFVGQKLFNHDITEFELRGSHNSVSCFECHDQSLSAEEIFLDKAGIEENDCKACHEDVHEGRFGDDCKKCHSEESWFALNNMDLFDHSMTDYPLEGLHVNVDCKECHINEKYGDPIDFANCYNCHEDYHNGEFVEDGVTPDCNECHTLENDFSYTTFGLTEHQESEFPLEGAHIATPCFACHVSEEHWNFRDIGINCIDCHEDVHDGKITASFYPEKDCTACHNSDSWTVIDFDHDVTDWPLTGEHVSVSCRECHYDTQADAEVQIFADLGQDCITCHENVHDDQFAIDGVTDCMRCHITESWEPLNFDHDLTDFPLDGQHIDVECRACHKEEVIENGRVKVIYQIESFRCIDCHS